MNSNTGSTTEVLESCVYLIRYNLVQVLVSARCGVALFHQKVLMLTELWKNIFKFLNEPRGPWFFSHWFDTTIISG